MVNWAGGSSVVDLYFTIKKKKKKLEILSFILFI